VKRARKKIGNGVSLSRDMLGFQGKNTVSAEEMEEAEQGRCRSIG